MCFSFDARPPELPADLLLPAIGGGAGAEIVELQAACGSTFGAAISESTEPRDPAVIVLPDVRGLYPFYIELSERFANASHHAIAIDYFGRTAGTGARGADFDFAQHLARVSVAGVHADIAAARRALCDRLGARAVVTVGFCFGGAHSFLAATNGSLELEAVVGFYGTLDPSRLTMPFAMPDPLRTAHQTRFPVLGLFGGADPYIPGDDIAAFGRALTAADVPHELVTYPGAPHSFFDRSFEEHAADSEDAWRRVLGFLAGLPALAATSS